MLLVLGEPPSDPWVQGLAVSKRYRGKNGPSPEPSMPGGNMGCAPKPTVRFVTAVPDGTPGKSRTPVVLNQITLRAFVAATSALNTVPSCMR